MNLARVLIIDGAAVVPELILGVEQLAFGWMQMRSGWAPTGALTMPRRSDRPRAPTVAELTRAAEAVAPAGRKSTPILRGAWAGKANSVGGPFTLELKRLLGPVEITCIATGDAPDLQWTWRAELARARRGPGGRKTPLEVEAVAFPKGSSWPDVAPLLVAKALELDTRWCPLVNAARREAALDDVRAAGRARPREATKTAPVAAEPSPAQPRRRTEKAPAPVEQRGLF